MDNNLTNDLKCSKSPMVFDAKQSIEKESVKLYVYIMYIYFIGFACLFRFYLSSNVMAYILLGECVIFYCLWRIIENRLSIKKVLQVYFLITPLICIPVIFYFRSQPLVTCSWLVPYLYAIYLHFGSRQAFYYLGYSIFLVLGASFLPVIFQIDIVEPSPEKASFAATFEILGNILLTLLWVNRREKVNEVQVSFKNKEAVTSIEKTDENFKANAVLFTRLQDEMTSRMLFKDPEFGVSTLSAIVKISNNYVSKAVKQNGYINFSHYVNFHRINYVKQLIEKSDLTKLTLMYVYTEAGFSNQSTFNRVFKQFEGVTPSEYIQKIMKASP